MWGRRILYLLVLLAAFLVHIFNTHYLAAFFFWMVLAAPVLSILLSLPALLACRLELRCVPTDVVRGEEGRWEVALRGGGKLPLARVAFTLRLRRSLDGEKERLRRIYEGVSPGAVWTEEVEADHCQAVEGVLTAAWAADLLRLFALPLRRSPAVTMLVLPVSNAPASLPAAWGLLPAQAYAARTGQQLGEEYELRDYRPGDPIRSVHWKLSSKREDLIVRESSRQQRPTVLLTVDRFGFPGEADRVLDRLLGWSDLLLGREVPHVVQWVHPETGELRTHRLTDRFSQYRCLEALLKDPLPPVGRTVRDIPLKDRWQGEAVYPVHIGWGEEGDHETI